MTRVVVILIGSYLVLSGCGEGARPASDAELGAASQPVADAGPVVKLYAFDCGRIQFESHAAHCAGWIFLLTRGLPMGVTDS